MYPLKQHVSNYQTSVDNLCECSLHIGNAVPNISQLVEYLLKSISSQDNSLQATMRNICAGTNGLRGDFESASSHLVEVDPYTRSFNPSNNNRQANVSSVTFAG